jgi:predicted regulator of Ras-like GTPase activity (Roadblock/LC7/MglB family)
MEARMSRLEDLIQMMRADLPGFIALGVVHIESGLSIAETSSSEQFWDTSISGPSYSEVIKSNAQALDLLGIGSHTCEDILISLKNAYFLVRMLGKEHYMGLAISKQTTLGFARTVMKKYDPLLVAALKEMS